MNREKVSSICKAMGDLNRLIIVESLSAGEKCACHLLEELDITQPTLSHHMAMLSDCGLVHDRKEGRWHYYSLDYETIAEFTDFVQYLSCCRTADTDEIRDCCKLQKMGEQT